MVRKPPCALFFLKLYIFLKLKKYISLIFENWKEVHLVGWSWQLGCVFLTFALTQKTSMCMSMIFSASR